MLWQRKLCGDCNAGYGGTGCTETYQYKVDNGAWQAYTSGTNVGAGTEGDSVQIRANELCIGLCGIDCKIKMDSC